MAKKLVKTCDGSVNFSSFWPKLGYMERGEGFLKSFIKTNKKPLQHTVQSHSSSCIEQERSFKILHSMAQ